MRAGTGNGKTVERLKSTCLLLNNRTALPRSSGAFFRGSCCITHGWLSRRSRIKCLVPFGFLRASVRSTIAQSTNIRPPISHSCGCQAPWRRVGTGLPTEDGPAQFLTSAKRHKLGTAVLVTLLFVRRAEFGTSQGSKIADATAGSGTAIGTPHHSHTMAFFRIALTLLGTPDDGAR